MNGRLIAYLTLCVLALTPASAAQVRDDTYFKNTAAFDETFHDVLKEGGRVRAQCKLDAGQYIDEHPQLQRTDMDVYFKRLSLCMETSGYPPDPIQHDEASIAVYYCASTWDRNARIRKRWAEAGRDIQWLDQYLHESPYGARDHGC